QHALTLQEAGRRYDEDIVAPALAPALKEEWHIEHGNRLSPRQSTSEKPLFLCSNHRVNDLLEPEKRLRVREDTLPEKRAINPAFGSPNTRKRRRDPPYGGATRRQ